MMYYINILISSPYQKNSPKAQDSNTVFLDNWRDTPFEGRHSTKNGGMWTPKHEIISPKFYELLINT